MRLSCAHRAVRPPHAPRVRPARHVGTPRNEHRWGGARGTPDLEVANSKQRRRVLVLWCGSLCGEFVANLPKMEDTGALHLPKTKYTIDGREGEPVHGACMTRGSACSTIGRLRPLAGRLTCASHHECFSPQEVAVQQQVKFHTRARFKQSRG